MLQAQGPPHKAGKVVAAQQGQAGGQHHAPPAVAEVLACSGEVVYPAQGAASAPLGHPKTPQQPA